MCVRVCVCVWNCLYYKANRTASFGICAIGLLLENLIPTDWWMALRDDTVGQIPSGQSPPRSLTRNGRKMSIRWRMSRDCGVFIGLLLLPHACMPACLFSSSMPILLSWPSLLLWTHFFLCINRSSSRHSRLLFPLVGLRSSLRKSKVLDQ